MDLSLPVSKLPPAARNKIAGKLETILEFDNRVPFAENLASLMGEDNGQTAILSFHRAKTSSGYVINGPMKVDNLSLVLQYASEHKNCPSIDQVIKQLQEVQPRSEDEFKSIFSEHMPEASAGAASASAANGGSVVKAAFEPKDATSAIPDPYGLGVNGDKSLKELSDPKEFADGLREYLDTNARASLARKLAKAINKTYAKDHELKIKKFMDDRPAILDKDKNLDNIHGVLLWAMSETECPTLNTLLGIIIPLNRGREKAIIQLFREAEVDD